MIEANIIHEGYRQGVEKLLFLGSIFLGAYAVAACVLVIGSQCPLARVRVVDPIPTSGLPIGASRSSPSPTARWAKLHVGLMRLAASSQPTAELPCPPFSLREAAGRFLRSTWRTILSTPSARLPNDARWLW
jgi:hypothetical protein